MGYYDNNETRMKQTKSGRNWFLPSAFGAIVGASIMLFAAPYVSNIDQPSTNQDAVTASGNVETSNVAYNVSSDITSAVQKAQDAVVSITSYQSGGFSLEDPSGQSGQAASSGSGVIYKNEGGKAFVVTNNHVVEGASSVEVTLSNEKKAEANVLGTDALMDLAVLEIDAKDVEAVAELGSSSNLQTGEPAIAVGNPLGFLEGSVTQGIISNPSRTIPVDLDQNGQPDYEADVIQTDASINPGNSGGALINIKGQLIGINSSKIAEETVEGIGFAIPIEDAQPIIDQLEMTGEVKRPVMGVTPASLAEVPTQYWTGTLNLPEDVESGVVLMGIAPNSPASEAGLKEGDVVVKLDDTEVKDSAALRKYLYSNKEVGDKMEVTFYRDGKLQTVTMTLANQNGL
ncbi:S1C family serine protease [Pseudalkalibacillus hwajinpoensis]|uniref:S1C family serine protease n=1 Tax=Guptibacillus hwajinpoensis TaxID=208199 RepID=UPI001CD2709F|nr:trypsin-like peptidase domain-containing protein [Pseudalkalibacillus hwajinpoensis]MCA0993219.1 trypsin-like peptidase domain-containing protein [Pseudalkalibacillus hwajinpoensis]